MALCKAMILIGALLIVPTLGKRMQQMYEPMPHQLEEMMEHAGDRTMEQMGERNQQELGQALVEEVVEKDAADEVVAAVGGALVPRVSETGAVPTEKAGNSKLRRSRERKAVYGSAKEKTKAEGKMMEAEMMDNPRAPPSSPVARDRMGPSKAEATTEKVAGPRSDTDVDASSSSWASSSSSSEDAIDEAEPMAEAAPGAELVAEDEEVALAREDLRHALNIIQQGKETEGKEKKGEGKDKGKVKVKGKYLRKDAAKVKEYRLVKGNANKKTKGERQFELLLSNAEERPDKRFRFPVWGGSWWLTRLAFQRGPFHGFIYQQVPSSKTLLVKAWKALEEFGGEAIILLSGNCARAKVGDKITFDVQELAQEGEGMPRPMARNVIIRQRGHAVGDGIVKAPTITDVRSQVLYYISDENLRRDRFFQDIIATTEGGWISIDFFLLCPRLKQLGASTKSIIKSLRDAPGVEIRDMPGQEAVRRTRPPPPLKRGAVARQSLADGMAVLTKVPVLAKMIYTRETMKNVLRFEVEKTMEKLFGQNREELAEAVGPEADELRRAIAVAEAEGSEYPEEQKDAPTRPKQEVKKVRRGSGVARQAQDQAWGEAKKGEKEMEHAEEIAVDKVAVEKVAAQKPTAKKDLAVTGQAAADRAEKAVAEKPAAKKGRAKARPAVVEKSMAEKASKEAGADEAAAAEPMRLRRPSTLSSRAVEFVEQVTLMAKHKADGEARHAKDNAKVEDNKAEKAKERAKKAAANRAAVEAGAKDILAIIEKPEVKKAFAEAESAAVEAVEAEAADEAGIEQAVAEMVEQAAVATVAETAKAASAAVKAVEAAAADDAEIEQVVAEMAVKEAAEAIAAETAEALSSGVPAATSYNKVSWRSWFSLLPSSAWGYLRLHGDDADATMSRILLDEENNKGEQDADDAREQQQDMQDVHKKRRTLAEAQKEQRAIARTLARARKPTKELAMAREEE